MLRPLRPRWDERTWKGEVRGTGAQLNSRAKGSVHLGALLTGGFPGGLSQKESTCNSGHTGELGLIPGSGRFSWRRKWPPTPVFLPGESQGQRSLAGYRPWGHSESGTTERLWTPWAGATPLLKVASGASAKSRRGISTFNCSHDP